jgi:hypothetical protein
MSEKNFWTLVRNSLDLKMYRVENRVMQGMPDVHYIRDGKSGWIELKYLDLWPKKRIACGLMLSQSLWLKEYKEHKGKCWILLRVGRDFIGLIDGKDAKTAYNRPSSKDFIDILAWKNQGNMTEQKWKELADFIAGEP